MFRTLLKTFGLLSLRSSAEPVLSQSQEHELTPEIVPQEVVSDVQCFSLDGTIHVALFGSPSDLADNWLRNCRWDDVFDIYPKQLPFDHHKSLRNAHSMCL